ncbi:MAG: methyltransferase domain-containing protein [Gammaproteobacteria bacterium]|nr:methyltransferase domain-containing protein [Gammaproteobacteria bacterium]
MSFLYCIKDPVPFIMLGGVSAIGKTTIVDYLLSNYKELFEQPISYTTRKKRNNNERYKFISKEQIISLYKDGKIANLDEVYGEYYGVSVKSLKEIVKFGKIPVKEIHPNNFHKFKPKKSSQAISILIENRSDNKVDKNSKREGRPKVENWSDINSIDIKLNIAGLSVQKIVSQLFYRVIAFRRHISQYEHPNKIEAVNKYGYDQIAEEFEEGIRTTTKNFHDISFSFWKKQLDLIKVNEKVLEIGIGNGWLFSTLSVSTKEIYGADLSNKMHASYIKKMYSCSSRAIPINAESIDYIVSSLADPFLYPETLVEAHRILKSGGKFIFTLPSLSWAKNLKTRKNVDKTTFKKLNGANISVYSICNGVESMLDILLILNMEIELVHEMYLPENYDVDISSAIIDSANQQSKSVEDIPIVMGYVIKKQ